MSLNALELRQRHRRVGWRRREVVAVLAGFAAVALLTGHSYMVNIGDENTVRHVVITGTSVSRPPPSTSTTLGGG